MNILSAIQKKDITWIREYSQKIPIADIASDVEELPIMERVLFFRMLNTEIAGEIFSYLPSETQEELIKNFSDDMIHQIIDELYTDEIADLIEEIPQNLSQRVLKNIDVETRKVLNRLLKYTDEQIGSIMSVDIVSLKYDLSPSEALKIIRKQKDEAELVHYYYIVDEKKKVLGAVTLEDIVFAKSSTIMKDLMFAVPVVYTTDDKPDVANIFAKSDLSVLPVMNSSNRLVGMVTSDDIIDILNEEATEDIYKMAGINSDEIEDNYLKTSVLKIVKSRIFWLIILMLGSTLSQVVIQAFTESFEHHFKSLGLSAFISTIVSIIPVISGSAGNAGSQSATTITRSLSLGEIKTGSMKKVLTKELLVGLTIGTILMIINFARLLIYFSITRDLFNTELIDNRISHYAYILIISFAASFAMLLVIVFSKILGTVIPLLAAKMKKDPAVMSAPILATLTDATSTFIFFGITILIFILI